MLKVGAKFFQPGLLIGAKLNISKNKFRFLLRNWMGFEILLGRTGNWIV
jgi:hypothetical protein